MGAATHEPVGAINVVDPHPLNWLFITWNTMEEPVRTDEQGHIVRSSIRWRHPGVEPMNFIEPNIRRAIYEWGNTQKAEDVIKLLQGIPGVQKFFQQMRRTK